MFKEIKNRDCILVVGPRTVIGENVVLGPRCKKVKIGFGCFIGRDVYIDVDELSIGDYSTIHHGCVIHGVKTTIGNNNWIGHYTIIDSLGGDTRLGDNVGVGAHSQLWSHMKFGDTMAGCNWNSSGRLHLDDDVWLVGHSIVAPIHAEKKAMLLTGSVATKNMLENHIYHGSPAKDVTEKFGAQFIDRDVDERLLIFEKLKQDFFVSTGIDVSQFQGVRSFCNKMDHVTQFNVAERSYIPRRTDDEYRFIKFMLYDKAKFVPVLSC